MGFTLSREEELLMAQLEGVAAELATPTQFRGKLHELLSCVRLQSQNPGEIPGQRRLNKIVYHYRVTSNM